MLKVCLSVVSLLLLLSCKDDFQTGTSPLGEKKRTTTLDPINEVYYSVANKEFNTGGGLGGYFIEFEDDKTFSTFGFCDICPGSGTIGSYTQKSKAIYMLDSLCFVNEPHFTDSSVFVDCEYSTMTMYYLVRRENVLYLSSNPKDTLDPENAQLDFSNPSCQLEAKHNHLFH